MEEKEREVRGSISVHSPRIIDLIDRQCVPEAAGCLNRPAIRHSNHHRIRDATTRRYLAVCQVNLMVVPFFVSRSITRASAATMYITDHIIAVAAEIATLSPCSPGVI